MERLTGTGYEGRVRSEVWWRHGPYGASLPLPSGPASIQGAMSPTNSASTVGASAIAPTLCRTHCRFLGPGAADSGEDGRRSLRRVGVTCERDN
jgi:hypothetical protein